MDKRVAWIVANRNVVIDARFLPPYAPDTLAEWGSVTKPVIGAAIAELVAVGQLSYEALACELLESDRVHPAATLRDLVRHTSGLPRVHPGMKAGISSDPYRGLDEAAFAGVLARLPYPPAAPGDVAYSNLGYALLGRIIEAVTGGDWFSYARDTVLARAGITTATLRPAPDAPRALLKGWGRREREPWRMADGPYAAAGGLWSTLDDLHRFVRHAGLTNPGDPSLEGWQVQGRWIWHNGQTRDSGVCAVVNPRTGVAVVVHTSGRLPYTSDKIAMRLMTTHDREAQG